jgi:sugar phosphate isomerase/epimerase
MKISKPLPRRQFLQLSALGLAGASLGLAGCATTKYGWLPKKKIPIGLELYSVRNECKADFPGTIEQVAKIGYKGVEFAGYWGRSAKEIRQMVDDNGLVTCGSHTPYEALLPDKIDATIEFNQVIGNKFIICPYMVGKTRAEWLAHAQMFNDLADKLKPLGLFTGYHAHQHDFQLIEGESAWDIFFGNTKKEVIMQLDTSNCRDGGQDPVVILNKYPGRVRTIHIKPNGGGPEAVIGEDKINWAGVFEFCEHRGNTEWYVVEHETSKQPLKTVARMYDALKKFGKV